MSDAHCLVDLSHVAGRRITGIERLSIELFSPGALPGVRLRPVTATGRWSMLATQLARLPWRMARAPGEWIICPGFPPSLPLSAVASDRTITCVHDLFLLTRGETLSAFARYYMRPGLHRALSIGRHFIVFSETVRAELRGFCHGDASIALYRPTVRNVFGLQPASPPVVRSDGPIRLLSIGTVEPRKNYPAAVAIARRVGQQLGRGVELHIVGRPGWGPDVELLERSPEVHLHGYLDEQALAALIARCDAFIYPTLAEGLGLPVLEVQFAGLPIIANDLPILRETLGDGALFIPACDHAASVEILAAGLEDRMLLQRLAAASLDNIARWNALAAGDRARVAETVRGWIAPR